MYDTLHMHENHGSRLARSLSINAHQGLIQVAHAGQGLNDREKSLAGSTKVRF